MHAMGHLYQFCHFLRIIFGRSYDILLKFYLDLLCSPHLLSLIWKLSFALPCIFPKKKSILYTSPHIHNLYINFVKWIPLLLVQLFHQVVSGGLCIYQGFHLLSLRTEVEALFQFRFLYDSKKN